jgi:hypothetical protein
MLLVPKMPLAQSVGGRFQEIKKIRRDLAAVHKNTNGNGNE